jgi:hypothetical protein
MFKFFRKYNKYLLPIGASVLMVLFLIPNISNIFAPDPREQEVGVLDGEPVTLGQRQQAQAEMALLRELGLGVPLAGEQAELRWLLMRYEARQQGLYAASAQAEQLIKEIDPAKLAEVKRGMRASDTMVTAAVQDWIMVRKLQEMVLQPRRISEPQLRHFARDVMSPVSVRALPIRAEWFTEQVEQPSEADLQDQFERYAAQSPGQSAPWGFGYRLPPAVKLEYIMVPLDRIEQAVRAEDWEIEASRYYQENREQFIPEPEEGEQASSAEPKPYTEVRQQIIDMLVEQHSMARRDAIIKWCVATLTEYTRRLALDAERYREVPPGFVPMSLERLAEQVQREFGILPTVVRRNDELLELDELVDLPQLGEAYIEVSIGGRSQPVPVPLYIASVRELRIGTRDVLASLRLQEDLASDPVYDASGNGYLFRVTEAVPARVPRDLEEVREQVERDVRKLRAYVELQDRAEQYLNRAQADGLDALAESLGEQAEVTLIEQFTRRQLVAQQEPVWSEGELIDIRQRIRGLAVPELPVVGRNESFVDDVFNLAEEVRQFGGLDNAPPDARFASSAIDPQFTVYVVELTEFVLPTTEDYRQFKTDPQIVQAVYDMDMARIAEDPFSYEALKQRLGFRSHDEIEGPAQESSESPATAGG